jgi:sphinganine C4-monooxygenase
VRAGLAPKTAMLFWSLSYFKTVSDHSGFKFPVNPTNIRGCNNAEYHDVHHNPKGIHYNFSQPYFTFWDQIYGSFKDPHDGVPLPEKKQL